MNSSKIFVSLQRCRRRPACLPDKLRPRRTTHKSLVEVEKTGCAYLLILSCEDDDDGDVPSWCAAVVNNYDQSLALCGSDYQRMLNEYYWNK